MADQQARPRTAPPALDDVILRSVVDHAIVTLDADGIVTSWSEGAERILGWSEADILGRSASAFFTPEDCAGGRPAEEMRLALSEGRADDERWHIRKDGQRFWGSGLMMPLLAEEDGSGRGGQIGGFVKIFRDRTEERTRRLQVERLENRAALAMRHSGTVGVYDLDLRENVVTADDICARMHRVSEKLAAEGTSPERFFDGIDETDRAGVRAALAAARQGGMDFDQTYRVLTDGPRPRWIRSQSSVQRDERGHPARLSGIVVDITGAREHLRMQEARLALSENLREMSDPDEIAALAARVIAQTLYIERAGYGVLYAGDDVIDIRADWTAPGTASIKGRHRYSDFGDLAAALHRGEDVIIPDVRSDPRVPDPGPLEGIGARTLVNLPLMEEGCLSAVLFANDDRPREWSEVEIDFLKGVFDRTYAAIERARYEAERDVMAAELTHRMKNMLTMAQVIVNQTLRQRPGLDRERGAIAARLNALAGAQDVLGKVSHTDADIAVVLDATLAPHRPADGRISLQGPPVPLRSQQVLGLSLAIHELATNAAKYGALSNETGRIEITWSLEGCRVSFAWRESGGPPVTVPEARGFGSAILERLAGSYFNGRSQMDYAPDGLVFRIEGTLDENAR